MSKKTVVILYLILCGIVASFCIYGIVTEGWEPLKSTVYIAAAWFGGIGLLWFIIDKIQK